MIPNHFGAGAALFVPLGSPVTLKCKSCGPCSPLQAAATMGEFQRHPVSPSVRATVTELPEKYVSHSPGGRKPPDQGAGRLSGEGLPGSQSAVFSLGPHRAEGRRVWGGTGALKESLIPSRVLRSPDLITSQYHRTGVRILTYTWGGGHSAYSLYAHKTELQKRAGNVPPRVTAPVLMNAPRRTPHLLPYLTAETEKPKTAF